MANSCAGDCCKRFNLPKPLGYFKRAYNAWLNKEPTFKWRGEVCKIPLWIHILYPMLIPLEGGKKVKWRPSNRKTYKEGCYHFTCKHLKNARCSIYNERPPMCSEFPYKKPCPYNGCQYKGRGCDPRKANLLNKKK